MAARHQPESAALGRPYEALSRMGIVSLLCLEFGLESTTLLPCSGERFAVAVVDPHEGVAPVFVVPAERSLDRGARHPGPFQQVQRGSHDRALHLVIPGLSAGISRGSR